MVGHSDLSEREMQILRLVATGAGNKEIANQLSISTNTVKVHLRNIFDKIQVSSRTEAAMYAVQQGLVDGRPGESLYPYENSPQDSSFQEGYPTSSSAADVGTETKPATIKAKQTIVWGSIIVSLVLLVAFFGFLLNQQNSLSSEELSFDSTRWEQLPDFENGREGLALVLQSNQLFAIGGTTTIGITDQVFAFQLETGGWQTKNPKPTPVSDVQAVTIAGLIYVPGGIEPTGKVVDVLEIYNPAKDAWTKGAPLPEPRCCYSLVAVEGMLFLFSGWDGNTYQDETYIYDPVEDRWGELTPMITPRAWTGGAISGGRIYIFGGKNESGISDRIDVFTPPNANEPFGIWAQASPLPMKRYAFGATSLADLIFIVGGRGEDEKPLTNLVFYPEINQWRSFSSPLPEGIVKQGITGAGTHLYIAGGELGSEILNQVYTYQAFFTASLPIVR